MAAKNPRLELYIPKEIIAQIVARLPLKSLLRVKCVSKEWHSLISDPKFAKSHFQEQPLRHWLLFREDNFQALDLHTPVFGASVRHLTCPFTEPEHHQFILIGSCNGLVCVAAIGDSPKFYIWNPTTGFFKKLPDLSFACDWDELFGYGFGYVSATDDYKLLVSYSLYVGYRTLIFSSRNNSWKTLENTKNTWEFMTPGILSNEALHWAEGKGILAFDLATEKFHELALPIEQDYPSVNFPIPLVPLDGCLTAICFVDDGQRRVEFWVMRKYGVEESWTKFFKFVVEDLTGKDDLELDDQFVPVYVESGRVVAICSSWDFVPEETEDGDNHDQFVRLDREEDELDNAVVRSGIYSLTGWDPLLNAIKYDESLLFLNDDHGVEDQNDSPRRNEEE